MSLPSLFEPSGLPAFLAAGLGIDPQDLYATMARGTGHRRKRRVYTTAQRVVTVARVMTAAQMAAYDDWFENTITVGETHFTAWISNQGPGQLYWDACWVEPPNLDPVPTPRGIFWRLAGKLLLSGEGTTSKPEDGSLAIEYAAHLRGAVVNATPVLLAIEYSAGLDPAVQLAIEYSADLLHAEVSFLEREDGTDFQREDGGKIQRE